MCVLKNLLQQSNCVVWFSSFICLLTTFFFLNERRATFYCVPLCCIFAQKSDTPHWIERRDSIVEVKDTHTKLKSGPLSPRGLCEHTAQCVVSISYHAVRYDHTQKKSKMKINRWFLTLIPLQVTWLWILGEVHILTCPSMSFLHMFHHLKLLCWVWKPNQN